jgi:probable rRNA maturation factor
MLIKIFDQQTDLKISRSSVKAVVKQVLTMECTKCDEVSVYFVNTKTISSLHKQFFGDSSTTDTISFPLDLDKDENYRILGEVFVCPKTGVDYASEYQSDAYFEITLYLVHGLLHLLGYDDLGKKEIEMRHAEHRHMNNLHSQQILLCAKKITQKNEN